MMILENDLNAYEPNTQHTMNVGTKMEVLRDDT